jgi:hypothetical protein
VNQIGLVGSDGDFHLLERHPTREFFQLDPERPVGILTFPIQIIRGVSEKVFRFRFVAEGQEPQDVKVNYGDLLKAADGENFIST